MTEGERRRLADLLEELVVECAKKGSETLFAWAYRTHGDVVAESERQEELLRRYGQAVTAPWN